ncbi:MAG TPA: MOSC domain-containing protein [Usitatibacter sp.]|nr:MOSC domain-containing protein [Usitatibacter sp.]
MATVTHIFVAPMKGAPARSLQGVEALANQGLEGDRYAEARNRRGPGYEVTLVELENIRGFTQATGLAFTPEMSRRNIVTEGIALNALVGKRFGVGEAVFEGLELCEPCRLLAKRTHREVLQVLAGKGGLRARIVSGGVIRVGDSVTGKIGARYAREAG